MALAVIALLPPLAGCSKKVSPYEQPYDRVDSAPLGAPPGVGRTSAPLKRGFRGLPWFPHLTLATQKPADRLHPRLRQWLVDSAATTRVRVVIGLRERVRLPRLPIEALEADTMWAPAPAVTARIDALVDSVRQLRAPFYLADTSMLANAHGARILETYTLTQGVLAEVALGELPAIAARANVLSIQPASSGDLPPACLNPTTGKTVDDARSELRTSSFVSSGYAGRGSIAMLDTGVDSNHDMLRPLTLTTPPRLTLFDCTDPAQDCFGPNTGDLDVANRGHGTKTASILVGNGSVATQHKGITTAKLQSYQLYKPYGSSSATLDDQAFERSVLEAAKQNSVLLAEVQSGTLADGFVSMAANAVCALGGVVVAAVGDGGTSWIGAPGSAAWVMGVGAYEMTSGKPTYTNESRGLALERTKPDVQAPTMTLAASTNGLDCLGFHTATSGAAPYGAAVALLLRNWMGAKNSVLPPEPVDPGQVYAAMIACGSDSRPAGGQPYSKERGAGWLRLPGHGRAWWGKTQVGTLGPAIIAIPVPAGSGLRKFHAAIWWPDPPTPMRIGPSTLLVSHVEYSLDARLGSTTLRGRSRGPNSPFESVHMNASSVVSGTFKLTITAQAPGFDELPVYWFFYGTP